MQDNGIQLKKKRYVLCLSRVRTSTAPIKKKLVWPSPHLLSITFNTFHQNMIFFLNDRVSRFIVYNVDKLYDNSLLIFYFRRENLRLQIETDRLARTHKAVCVQMYTWKLKNVVLFALFIDSSIFTFKKKDTRRIYYSTIKCARHILSELIWNIV